MAGMTPQQPPQQRQEVGGAKGAGGTNNLVVRIDGDGDSDLQALFDSVLKPDSKRPLQVPLRMRKLPNSFFNPPRTGSKSPSISHSRENSADSAFGSSPSAASSSAAVNPSSSPSPSPSPAAPPPPLQVCHPRAHSSPASLQQTYASAQPMRGQQQQGSMLGHQHAKQRSYDLCDDLTPLPPGWEQARTPEGQVYYLNHITRTTTWEDPRKSLAVQVQRQQQVAASSPNADVVGVGAAGALPDGWEQAATSEGEIYFINHQTRTTSWFDPRIPIHLQRPAVLQQSQQVATGNNWSHRHSSASSPTSPSSPSASARQSVQACQQKLRLQSLEMERERLKLRQQEIMRQQQEMMLRQAVVEDPTAPINSDAASGGSQGATAGTDPFLGGPTDHSRQESADSGLGMGNPYSMPHTPEDFLSNIDDNMDGVNEGGSPVGGDEMGGGLDAPDISSLGSDNVDPTDDLVPSLQQLSEEFSSDILDDVQSLINPSKPDNALTWL